MFSRFRVFAVVLVLASVLLTAVACNDSPVGGKEEPTPTPIPPPPEPIKATYVVKRGEVVDSLTFSGRISPVVEKALFFQTDGRVKTVYVDRNEMVKAGQILAELDNEDLKRQLAQAELELETAKQNLASAQAALQYNLEKARIALRLKELQLAKMEAQSANPDLEIARANLQRAEAALKAAQRAYDARAALPGAAASQEALRLEQATLDYQIAKANYDRTVININLAKYDLEMQREQVALAKLDYDYLNKPVDIQLTNAVERSKLAVERLKTALDKTVIVSPIDGKVTSMSLLEGNTVAAFKPVIVVADESQLEITSEPPSSDMRRLAEGMEATIILSAYPGKELKGKIVRLPYPYGSGGGSTAAADTDKLVHISFDAQDLEIKPGDLVKVMVTLQRKENALWLPPAAIRTFAGRRFVVIQEEGRERRVDVTIGIESPDRVEILEGVEEGQVIVGQ